MYFRLTSALKNRMIEEIRRYWMYHPKYLDLVDKIQGKYSFRERPSYGVIVKTSGGTKVDLAADNYVGMVESYVFLAKVPGSPGVAVEWVREDARAIQQNGGRFPSRPGIYYIELTEDDEFHVDSLLDVQRESVQMSDAQTGHLANPPVAGTLRLYEMPSGFLLHEGENYTLEYEEEMLPDGGVRQKPTGVVHLTSPLTGGRSLSADYRHVGMVSGGPFPLIPNHANNQAIPGCVLAFGNRNKKGDRLAVVVQGSRQPAALAYGGRWDISLDVDVMARDVEAQQEIADSTVIYLWGVLRSRLAAEGIEMTDLSLGGESEEVYDENGDDYFYTSSFSLTLQTDWEIHVPLPLYLRHAAPLSVEKARMLASLPDDRLHEVQSNLEMVASLGLEPMVDPFFRDRTNTFEMIR